MEDAGRDLAQRLLDKISTDGDFRARLVSDHQGALEEEGFLGELRQLRQSGSGSEVEGHLMVRGGCSAVRISCISSHGVPSGPVG
ncbi:MAG: hypothetical protein ACRDIE_16770 [Chloroflexota bacterium]